MPLLGLVCKERMVHAAFSTGQMQYYQGERGTERMVRVEYPDGRVEHFEGEQGTERVVRVEYNHLRRMRTSVGHCTIM